MKFLLAVIPFLLACVTALPAQQPAAPSPAQERVRTADTLTTLSVGLRDGSTLVGRVLGVRGDSVGMRTAVGSVTFALADVTRATVVRTENIVGGEYWPSHPNTTRLLFGPTGRMLKRGTGYFSDHEIFLPGVAYGVADRVTLGGGMSIIPGLGLDEQLFYLLPKVGLVSGPKTNIAAGAMIMRVGSDAEDQETFGVGYVVGTFGGENGSLTAGLGFGFADGDFVDRPAVMVGGEKRITRRVALVTENYVFPGGFEGALVSGAVRFLGEKISADVGFGRIVGDRGNTATIPFLGLLVNF